MTASLSPGNVTATGTLPKEDGANFTSSTLLLVFFFAQLREAAWEMPGSSDTGKAGLHTAIESWVGSSAGSTWPVSLTLLVCCAHHPERAQ